MNRRFFAGLFLFCIAYFGALSAVTAFIDPDAYYHAKMAQLIAERGELVHEFPWLSMTALGDSFVDHQFLYHVLLVPFVLAFPPLVGIKVATGLFAALFVVFFAWLAFHRLQVTGYRLQVLALLLLLTHATFVFRLNLAKTTAIALLFYFAVIACVLYRRTILLALLSCAYVWLYGGWPLAIVIAGLAWLATAFPNYTLYPIPYILFKHLFSLQNIKPFFAALIGAASGLVFNPYFPENIQFYALQTIQFPLSFGPLPVSVGMEWYSKGLSFIPENAIVIAAAFAAICALAWRYKGYRVQGVGYSKKPLCGLSEQLFLGLLTAVTAVLAVKSNRHIEYFVPTALLFASRTLLPTLSRLPALTEPITALACRTALRPLRDHLFAVYLIVAFGCITVANTLPIIAGHTSAQFFGWHTFSGATQWLKEHTSEGSRVWHDRWDDFPLLFFANSRNTYISGLDPRFLCTKDERLCREYEQISDGTVRRGVGKMIRDDFKSSVALVRVGNTALIEKLQKEKATVVYKDQFLHIFALERMDPAELAPASSGTNTDMLLYTPRARVHATQI